MRLEEILAEHTEPPVLPPPEQPKTPGVPAKSGVTAEGIPYTITVTGGDETSRKAVLRVNDLTSPVTQPVTIDPSVVRGNLDPRPAQPAPVPAPVPTPAPEPVHPVRDFPRMVLIHPVEQASYTELRAYVWWNLRADLHALEHDQCVLKLLLRSVNRDDSVYIREIPVYMGYRCHSALLHACRRNAAILTDFRHLLEFLRTGRDEHGSESFFNRFYHDHNNFRNAFWTFWNMKHRGGREDTGVIWDDEAEHEEQPTEDTPRETADPIETISELDNPPPTQPVTTPVAAPAEPAVETTNPVTTPETPAEDDGSGVPQRCETCGRFVSQISRCCSHCGRRY